MPREHHSQEGAAAGGLNDVELRRHLKPWSAARVLHVWTPYRRFGGRFEAAEDTVDFASRVHQGLKLAPRLQSIAQHVYRTVRRAAGGSFDCVDSSMDGEYAKLLMLPRSAHARPAAPSSRLLLMNEAARVLNRSSQQETPRGVFIVKDGGSGSASASGWSELRAHAESALGWRPLSMDDHMPPWYLLDFDTPSEHDTHARALAELRVCSRARRFIGNLAAPSTHSVCQMREQSLRSKARGRSDRRGGGCEDALGRTLPGGFAMF